MWEAWGGGVYREGRERKETGCESNQSPDFFPRVSISSVASL